MTMDVAAMIIIAQIMSIALTMFKEATKAMPFTSKNSPRTRINPDKKLK